MSDWEPHRRLVTVAEAAHATDRPAATIRSWVFKGFLIASARTSAGQPLYLEIHVLQVDADVRARRGRPVGGVRDTA